MVASRAAGCRCTVNRVAATMIPVTKQRNRTLLVPATNAGQSDHGPHMVSIRTRHCRRDLQQKATVPE
jgi:hypothetical protein